MTVPVPDIGDFKEVEVIEVLVKPGDTVSKEQSLITLESDKATMEIPSPSAGVVKEIEDQGRRQGFQGRGDPGAGSCGSACESRRHPKPQPAPAAAPAPTRRRRARVRCRASRATRRSRSRTPALRCASSRASSASISRACRAAGRKGASCTRTCRRSSKARWQGRSPRLPRGDGGALPFNLPAWPEVDFAKFGPVESKPLSRIQKLSGPYLHRNWISIPHVTQFDEADITDLEAFRKAQTVETEKKGFKLTMLAFMIKACVTALRQYPQFNSSLDKSGENIVIKKYFHIGVAVDTPGGLVVPVVRDADRKGVFDIARELSDISKLARDGKLKPGDMQGGTFSISSLGGIGGTAFTPIINAPEVAILGVSRSALKPVFPGKVRTAKMSSRRG